MWTASAPDSCPEPKACSVNQFCLSDVKLFAVVIDYTTVNIVVAHEMLISCKILPLVSVLQSIVSVKRLAEL